MRGIFRRSSLGCFEMAGLSRTVRSDEQAEEQLVCEPRGPRIRSSQRHPSQTSLALQVPHVHPESTSVLEMLHTQSCYSFQTDIVAQLDHNRASASSRLWSRREVDEEPMLGLVSRTIPMILLSVSRFWGKSKIGRSVARRIPFAPLT
jgi:hypothetical protein